MKRKTTLISRLKGVWALGFLLVASSCSESEFLDTVPVTSISDANVFSTPARLEGIANGLYKDLKNSSLYGGRYLLYLDVRGEDFINVTNNEYTAFLSWKNAYVSSSNDITNLWTAAYSTINDANILLQGIANNPGVVEQTVEAQYIAEAKFVRALSYFSLITIFAQPYQKDNGASKALPLRLQAETTSSNNDLARSTVAQIYTQILADLDAAEASLPATYSSALLNTTRAHRNTAIALKTRVYLSQGNYAKVIEEASKLVPQTAAPFSATTGVANALQSNFATVFTNYTTTESIFSMPMTTADSYSGQSSITYILNTNSEYYLNPAGILGNAQWAITDARRSLTRTAGGNTYLTKYAKASPYIDYIPVIRYSEVLLNYAEAAARQGDLTLAGNLLKAVHGRSDASYSFSSTVLDNQTSLINAILTERRIEFLGEGFRSNDLLRLLQTIPAKASNAVSTNAVSPSDENYIFPLSSSEITTNKLLLN